MSTSYSLDNLGVRRFGATAIWMAAIAAAGAIPTGGLLATAGAETINFTGDGTTIGAGFNRTTWPDLDNWQGGALPGANDTVAFIDASNSTKTWSGVTLNGNRVIGALDLVMINEWNIDPGSPAGTLTLNSGNILKHTSGAQAISAPMVISGNGVWQNLFDAGYTGGLGIWGAVTGTGSVTMIGPDGWGESPLVEVKNNGTIALPGITVGPRLELRVAGSTSVNRLADAMPIAMESGTFRLTAQSNANTTEAIGNLTISGLSAVLPSQSGTGTATISTPNLIRANQGALILRPSGTLGSQAMLKVGAGVPVANGMVAPWVLQQASQQWSANETNTNFVSYDAANGFVPFTAYSARTEADFGSAGATEVVSLTKSVNDAAHNPTLSGDLTIHALKISGFGNTDIAQSGGSHTLTLGSGGLIDMIGDVNIAPRLNFGSAEGVVYVTAVSYHTLTQDGGVDGSGGLMKVGQGSLTLNASNNTFTGPVTVNEGQLTIGGNSNSQDGVGLNRSDTTLSLRIARPGTFSLNNRIQRVASLDGDGSVSGNGTLTIVHDNTGTSSFSGVISSATNIIKQGDGTQVFSGNNTYTGTTTIYGGTLRIDGVTSGQGDYAVRKGGTLGGNGTIGLAAGKTLDVVGSEADLAVVSPGASVGHLSVGGDVTLGDLSALMIEVDAASSDRLSVSGALALVGTGGRLDIVGTLDPTGTTIYTLADYGTLAGTFGQVYYNGVPVSDPTGVGFSGYALDYGSGSNSTIQLVQSSVPEPASLGLLAMGGLALLGRRRQRMGSKGRV